MKNFRSATNSYLWYLRDQGYTVEGSHPYYQWFYNRQNINSYLGFERYRFYEGDYEKLTSAALPEDSVLYQEVYQDFVANKATASPTSPSTSPSRATAPTTPTPTTASTST